MGSQFFVSIFAVSLLAAVSLPAFAQEDLGSLTFPPQTSGDIVGHNLSELPKDSESGKINQVLSANKNYALEYRTADRVEMMMLIKTTQTTPPEHKIVAAIKLPKHSSEESINFNCMIDSGKTPPKGATPDPDAGNGFFALTKNSQTGLFSASRVWRANLESDAIMQVHDKKVICKSEGVEESK